MRAGQERLTAHQWEAGAEVGRDHGRRKCDGRDGIVEIGFTKHHEGNVVSSRVISEREEVELVVSLEKDEVAGAPCLRDRWVGDRELKAGVSRLHCSLAWRQVDSTDDVQFQVALGERTVRLVGGILVCLHADQGITSAMVRVAGLEPATAWM